MDIQEKDSKVESLRQVQYSHIKLVEISHILKPIFLYLLQVRSYYSAQNVTDVALYTEPEEIYLMKKNGDFETVLLFLSSLNSSCMQAMLCCTMRLQSEKQ